MNDDGNAMEEKRINVPEARAAARMTPEEKYDVLTHIARGLSDEQLEAYKNRLQRLYGADCWERRCKEEPRLIVNPSRFG